jgi:hypothetical protein
MTKGYDLIRKKICQPHPVCNQAKTAGQSICGSDSAIQRNASVPGEQVESAMRVDLKSIRAVRLQACDVVPFKG